MISYIIPTRNRPEMLALTMGVLGRLSAEDHAAFGGGEVIVIDNASRFPPVLPDRLANGLDVRVALRSTNDGAAARNAGARQARGDWLVMLDDDSHPMDTGFLASLADAPEGVAAIGAEIFLPRGRGADAAGGNAREAGGLPEVFIGCGVAVRRSVFLDDQLGGPIFNGAGYDPGFHYYAEEYDLAARMILSGYRVEHRREFRVLHHKAPGQRDMDTILRRLVRNNAWVEQRYAPEPVRRAAIQRVVSRYRVIAEKEDALKGYHAGLSDLDDTLDGQPRAEMTTEQYDRFTGLTAARSFLLPRLSEVGARRIAIVEPGKNDWVVRRVIEESGAGVVTEAGDADTIVIGTMSPGPMLDAAERWSRQDKPVLSAWELGPVRADRRVESGEPKQFQRLRLPLQLNGAEGLGLQAGNARDRLRHSA